MCGAYNSMEVLVDFFAFKSIFKKLELKFVT